MTIYNMERESILLNGRETDWNTLKSDIEIFYSVWTPIILDLYKLNINKNDILNFNNSLDKAIIFMKNEDKTNIIYEIANLYSYLPKYIEKYSNDNLNINLYKIKSCIINSYSEIEKDNWSEIEKQLQDAEKYFMVIINEITEDQKMYNIDKSYILFKKFQNSIASKDKELFYIKYKNLMEELNILK